MNLDGLIDLSSVEVLNFLNSDEPDYIIEPQIETDFEHKPSNRKELTPRSGPERAPFLALETYQLESSGTQVSTLGVHVFLEHSLTISVSACLALRDIPASAKTQLTALFGAFDQALHGDDIEQYMADNLGPGLNIDMYLLESAYTLRKAGNPVELDVSQRDALLKLYTQKAREPDDDVWANINLVPDMLFDQWCQKHDIALRLMRREAVLDSSPKPSDPILEVPKSTPPGHNANAAIDDFVDALLTKVVPSECGVMISKNERLLSLFAWPEFKLEWRTKRIRIWKMRITIRYPAIRVRISELFFYVYFALPQDVGSTAREIARTCAIRAALSAAVVGAVLGNIAAAIAAFTPQFIGCLQSEVVTCVSPGLAVVKEAGKWH